MRKFSLLMAMASLAFSQISFANQAVRLFVIERSLNANYVCYDANVTEDGTLDPVEPVSVYWIMAAEDGHREDLNAYERKHVYGFSLKPGPDQSLILITKASDKQEIYVASNKGSVTVETDFDSNRVYLKKIFVQTKGSIFPSVVYIKLTGDDINSGAEVEKMIYPTKRFKHF